jgi:hypothetical protein
MARVLAWIGAAAVTTAVYFYRFDPNLGSAKHTFAIEHPLGSLSFFFTAIGDVMGQPLHSDATNLPLLLIGIAIVAVAVVAAVRTFASRNRTNASPLGVVLICFGLLFAASITEGRSFLGLSDAATTRYTTCDLLVLVGAYLAWLGMPRVVRSSTLNRAVVHSSWVLLSCLVVTQMVLGADNGIQGARTIHRQQLFGADVLANISKASDGLVEQALYSFQSPRFIRDMARIAETHHLSLFDTDAVARYRREGIVPNSSTRQ